MAKKRKVVIVDKELTPTVLKNLDSKKGGWFILLFIFILFGLSIYFLPQISAFMDKKFKNNSSSYENTLKPNKDKDNNSDPVEDIKQYPYAGNLIIEEPDFTLDSFKINNNILAISINNKTNNSLNLSNYHYYLQIYNGNNTLLQRIKLDDIIINAKGKTEVNFSLNNTNITYFTFFEITEDEYPNYIPVQNQNQEAILVCRQNDRTINYLLKDNKLYQIEDLIEVNNTVSNYAELYQKYQAQSNSYNQVIGVNSSINIESGKLKFNTYIDLSKNGTENLNDITYPLDTDAKVMYFELVSKGYRCE